MHLLLSVKFQAIKPFLDFGGEVAVGQAAGPKVVCKYWFQVVRRQQHRSLRRESPSSMPMNPLRLAEAKRPAVLGPLGTISPQPDQRS